MTDRERFEAAWQERVRQAKASGVKPGHYDECRFREGWNARGAAEAGKDETK